MSDLPDALTVIQAIAAANGTLPGHPAHLTRARMIKLCRAWLAERQRIQADPDGFAALLDHDSVTCADFGGGTLR